MKAVGESMKYPLLYYHNNIISAMNLLEVSLFPYHKSIERMLMI